MAASEAHAPIAVFGASGQVGGAIAAQLIAGGQTVRTVSRRAARHRGAQHHRLAEWSDAELHAALAHCRAAFLMVPLVPEATALGLRLNAAAEAAGVPTVVRLSVLRGLARDGLALGRLHAAIDADLRQRRIRAQTILCPDSFMQNLLGAAPQVAAGELQDATGQGRMGFVDVDDIAACAVQALTGRAAPGIVDVTGPEALSMPEVAARFAAVLGRPVAYRDMPVDALRRQYLAWGMTTFLADTLAELAAWTRAQAETPLSDAVATMTGRPPTPLEAFIRRNREVWG